MANNKNRGFSIVEVVIAIAVFAVLMMPIVSSLISSIKNTTKSKTIQYRNEYAQDMVEYIKKDTIENIIKGDYFTANGTDGFSAVSSKGEEKKNSKVAEYETYDLSGSVRLGTKNKKYSYKIKISNQDYAKKEVEGSYVNPNNLKLGVVEDLDHTKLALINGTIANYDSAVANAFLAKKLGILHQYCPVKYEQYMSSKDNSDIFSGDTGNRKIIITVKKEIDGYLISCTLRYHDNSNVPLDGGKRISQFLTPDEDIEYTPYTAKFKELPDIYLMYNPCVYNGSYAKDDFIIIDTSEMEKDADKQPPVNVFIVETAEKYSDSITGVMSSVDSTDDTDKSLIFDSKRLTHDVTDRNDVNVYVAATTNSRLSANVAGEMKTLLNVYHNFGKFNDDGTPVIQKNQKNYFFYYSDDKTSSVLDAKYKGLTGHPDYNARVDSLDKATQEQRGLYKIEVWMNEGEISDVDTTNQDPILTGTKGGSES